MAHCVRDNLMMIMMVIIIVTTTITPWNRVLLEKLTVFQLVKKFPAFYVSED